METQTAIILAVVLVVMVAAIWVLFTIAADLSRDHADQRRDLDEIMSLVQRVARQNVILNEHINKLLDGAAGPEEPKDDDR